MFPGGQGSDLQFGWRFHRWDAGRSQRVQIEDFKTILTSQATLIAAVNAQMESAKLLGRVFRWFVLILSLTTALFHLGIAERVIVDAFSITFGGIALSLAIAFGRGGKEVARDFLENMYKRKRKEQEGEDQISHI